MKKINQLKRRPNGNIYKSKRMRKFKWSVLLISLLVSFIPVFSISVEKAFYFSEAGCIISLKNDTLVIENSLIIRTWKWNNGNIITLSLENKKSGGNFKTANKQSDLFLPKEAQKATNGDITAELVPDSYQFRKHVRTTIQYNLGDLQIRKIIKIYPDCPAIATELFYKGKASQKWFGTITNAADLKNIEAISKSNEAGKLPVMEQLSLSGKHWKIKAVEFFDVTDRFNTLVFPVDAILYLSETLFRGNLLFAENIENGEGLFMLKEAPNSNTQLYHPQGDFLLCGGIFKMIGIGIDSVDIRQDEWIKGYGYITGVYKGDQTDRDLALRNYQQHVRPSIPDRDEMIMLNTWGDRGQDTRVNEAFCLNELELAAKLGISHFQIDDGWQAGKSANSAFGGTFKDIWSNPDYWKPDPKRFPNGLSPIIKRGKELGIELGLWFNPSIQNSYADWEKDANAIISLHNEYGVKTFKIDGTNIPDKLAEVRLRKLYNKVMEATGWKIVLNLDATAGRRGGYFYFNEYGNFFLENRYTDWGNYYPYWTLRNLWMLSEYLPTQNFQIEFLNKWRNQEKYKGDRFAPGNYSFDYLFAITMVAQPLAWMEMANLPKEAFQTGTTIKKYREIQHDLHRGAIFPIGNEPDGKTWCGFQSIQEKDGYFLVFREDNKEQSAVLNTRLSPGKNVIFSPVLGDGVAFHSKTGNQGEITFSLPRPNSFALYHYHLKNLK